MSKIAVVFWSGTGNTEAMADAVAEGAKGAGAERTTGGLYGIEIYPIVGHSVYRHWTQANAGF